MSSFIQRSFQEIEKLEEPHQRAPLHTQRAVGEDTASDVFDFSNVEDQLPGSRDDEGEDGEDGIEASRCASTPLAEGYRHPAVHPQDRIELIGELGEQIVRKMSLRKAIVCLRKAIEDEDSIEDILQGLAARGTDPSMLCFDKILNSFDLEGIAKKIRDGDAKNIIVMTGAGLSTSAGIPDFRTPGTGLYDNLEKFGLPFAEAIFDIGFFKKNPKPFFVLSKELYPGNFKPTPSHYFIRLLHEKGVLLRLFTQNIDTLERQTGLPDDKVVEAHGSFHTAHCIGCGQEYTKAWVKEVVFADQVPQCEECEGLVKPVSSKAVYC
jgi:hypothetical protein